MNIPKKDTGSITLPINEQIRAPQLQVISADGEALGVMSREDALRIARTSSLDLVMVTEHGKEGIPVVKIVDYGKILYAKKKKLAEAKKHQKIIQVKEIKIRPKIGEHDYKTKVRQAFDFLNEGKHVKVTLMFKGREGGQLRERGAELFGQFEQLLHDFGLESIAFEKESCAGMIWTRVYFVKK
ncbi:MAG: translation initiation factor IF-3 [Candidatus Babeliales bacterium]